MKKAMVVVVCVLILAGAAFAQRPVRRAGHGRHANIAAAERLSRQAYARVVAAERANEWDLQGHAQKAKDLLEQVNTELKAAAAAANEGRR